MKSNFDIVAKLLRSESSAERILEKHRFEDLPTMTAKQLGISQSAFERLQNAIELGRRIQEEKLTYRNRIGGSSDAIDYCKSHFSRLITDGRQEEFHIVTLDTKNGVIDTHFITRGTLDASLVHPREVFRPAILDSASSIILVHNHPSGDSTPSREDIAVTDRLTESGKLIGIDVLDHIVIACRSSTSIREAT